MTNVPVPRVLVACEHSDGSFHLATELVPGIPMNELPLASQSKVAEEIEKYLKLLRKLQSNQIGGPTGIICSPPIAKQLGSDSIWDTRPSSTEEYVFCHNDLSQSNIIVNPDTLEVNGIIDWGFAGFFPQHFDIPFYQSSEPFGAQIRALADTCKVGDFLLVCTRKNHFSLSSLSPVELF